MGAPLSVFWRAGFLHNRSPTATISSEVSGHHVHPYVRVSLEAGRHGRSKTMFHHRNPEVAGSDPRPGGNLRRNKHVTPRTGLRVGRRDEVRRPVRVGPLRLPSGASEVAKLADSAH